ncbi:MAG: ABC transporter permease subunit, partial [candidate division NC10 bacterium]
IIPGAVSIWNVIILMNFFRGIPRELAEAASIDGASHWSILFMIYLPLTMPALATLALFSAVAHWNSWFDGMIYIRTMSNVPLQTYLKTVIVDNNFGGLTVATAGIFEQISQRSLRAAQVVVSTVPILLLYPFLQRYFITGLTLGSVKE